MNKFVAAGTKPKIEVMGQFGKPLFVSFLIFMLIGE